VCSEREWAHYPAKAPEARQVVGSLQRIFGAANGIPARRRGAVRGLVRADLSIEAKGYE